MRISGKALLAGIMGWPVSHSRSPRLHGYWLRHHSIDGAYLPLSVRPERFTSALEALADMGFRGVNITIPHKEAALAACHRVDALAERIGAVNMITMTGGEIAGSNTDGFGFIESLRHAVPGWRAASGPAAVIGAGGASRAVVAALLDDGSSEIRLVNRTLSRAQSLAADLGGPIEAVPWPALSEALAGAAVLVNTTSLGMQGHAPLEVDLGVLPSTALVTDLVYAPLETELLAAARARGNPAVGGLGMLLHQARPAFEAWFGVDPEVTEDLRAAVLTD